MTTYEERERRRARKSRTRLDGRTNQESGTGHPALFYELPLTELDHFPSGGGYPKRFLPWAMRQLGARDHAEVLHLCSGSVVAPLTIDARRDTPARVIADVRWLPIRPGSIRFALADPPYGDDYAEVLWGTGAIYPTPAVLVREVAPCLAVGGRLGLLHQYQPPTLAGLTVRSVHAISTGPGYRLRCFTVLERTPEQLELA